MKFINVLFLASILLISSCSTTFPTQSWNRGIANEINSPITLEELMTIKSSTNIKYEGQDFTEDLKEQLSSRHTQIEFQMIEDANMPSDSAFKIVPAFEKQKYQLNIYYSSSAINDIDALKELSAFFTEFQKSYVSNYSFFELYYNAQNLDFRAVQALIKLRLAAVTGKHNAFLGELDMLSMPERAKIWSEQKAKFDLQEPLYFKNKEAMANKRNAITELLDKASEDKQFKTLIAKNDRKGATELLKSYLPWEEMSLFEKRFWEVHLTVMADPLPIEDQILIYRGIDYNVLHIAEDEGKVLSMEDAIKEQKVFQMSHLMKINEGSWNERLHGLTKMNELFIATDANTNSEFTKTARITTMFRNHSNTTRGSPFLSYTPKFAIAQQFGKERMTAYFLDPRLLYFNFAASVPGEVEFFLPMASFPEDLAAIYDSKIHKDVADVQSFLKATALTKLEREFGLEKGKEIYERIQNNSKKFFGPIIKGIRTETPDEKMAGFFKQLIGKSAKEVSKQMAESADMPCSDLIQLFWK